MGNDPESESKKQRAIRYEIRFVMFSTPALGILALAFFLWTDLSFWFIATPTIACACGFLYLAWTTRLGKVINDLWVDLEILNLTWLMLCGIIDLAGWIIGAIGALIAIGWIR